MAWKLGLINHPGSELKQTIEYLQTWPAALKARGQFRTLDFSASIPYLADNMTSLLTEIGRGNPKYLFDLAPRLSGFGPVYILTVLFFVTQGKFPIYDKYAHVAALAIDRDLPPGSYAKYDGIQKWSDYQEYMNLLAPVCGACSQQLAHPPMLVSRPVDRALWVYGHFFETEGRIARTVKPTSTRIAAPTTSGASRVLMGRIRDLCQTTSDGWRRREIIVRQGPNGYPRERDNIYLIDSSGARYHDLPFIKGAGVQGYTCMGKPGALRSWFAQHYIAEQVVVENVYFEPTNQPNEYQI